MENAKVILEKNGRVTSCQMQGSTIEILALLLHGIAGLYNSQEGIDRYAIRHVTMEALKNDDPVWSMKGEGVKIEIPRKGNDE